LNFVSNIVYCFSVLQWKRELRPARKGAESKKLPEGSKKCTKGTKMTMDPSKKTVDTAKKPEAKCTQKVIVPVPQHFGTLSSCTAYFRS
jgi:hypothetical protein